MSLCLAPDCLSKNATEAKFCQKCGSKLLLQDRYRAIKIIGQGGFGKTFLARDEAKPSQPYCVIKQSLPDSQEPEYLEKASKLFRREAQRLDELGAHSQIPELLSYCNHEGRQYLVQEYIDGKNLAEELALNGVFNEQEIRAFLLDILSILQFIHAKQVIHRDIKPENIIRRLRDNKLVLVDFGASKEFNQTVMGYTSCIVGTAQYAAPEQLRGESRFSSDLYSLGVTCLHLLTNINPFDLFSTAENDWVWREYLAANNPISDELGKVLDKLVQQAIKKRYQSVEEVLADLNPGSNQVKPSWSESTSTPPPPVDPKYRQENIQPTATPSQDFDKLIQNLDKTWKGVQPPPASREKITPVTPSPIKTTPKNDGTLATLRIIAGFFAIPMILSLLDGSIGAVIFIGFIAFICANIAKNKKRDFWLWFFLGCLFSFLTLILISVLLTRI